MHRVELPGNKLAFLFPFPGNFNFTEIQKLSDPGKLRTGNHQLMLVIEETTRRQSSENLFLLNISQESVLRTQGSDSRDAIRSGIARCPAALCKSFLLLP